ncbi:hypothetical protein E4U51_005715 [Claviceps purpurea]|nr:hypothetical protein E4U51_005715 [Claviceps purpurea]
MDSPQPLSARWPSQAAGCKHGHTRGASSQQPIEGQDAVLTAARSGVSTGSGRDSAGPYGASVDDDGFEMRGRRQWAASTWRDTSIGDGGKLNPTSAGKSLAQPRRNGAYSYWLLHRGSLGLLLHNKQLSSCLRAYGHSSRANAFVLSSIALLRIAPTQYLEPDFSLSPRLTLDLPWQVATIAKRHESE